MSIAVVTVGTPEARQILSAEENHFLDLKAVEVAPAKLARSIAAFANADGGELFVGVDENKTSGKMAWRGFSRPEDANGHLQAFEDMFPLGQYFGYEFLRWSGQERRGVVLHVTIQSRVT